MKTQSFLVCFSVYTSYMLDVTIDRHEPKGSSVKVKKLTREPNLVHHINIKSKMSHKWVSFQKIGFMLCVKCFDQIPSDVTDWGDDYWYF